MYNIHMATITNYIEQLEKLKPEDQYGFFLEKGSGCSDDVALTPDNFVKGPMANLWITASETPVGWEFQVSKVSGASAVDNGIGVMVCDILDGLSTEELNQTVWKDFVDLGKLLTKNDKQLIQAVLNKCKDLSASS